MIRDTSGQDQQITVNKRSNIKIGLLGAALFLGVVVSANAVINTGSPQLSLSKSSLNIATVTSGSFVRDVAATGFIVAANAPQAYSPEQGFVTLKVKAGDTVTLGQTIALVDSPELENVLKQQQSELARLHGELSRRELEARRDTLALNNTLDLAKVELAAAQRENRRAQLSIKQSLISQIDLEQAQDDLARAELTYQHAVQEAAIAKDTLAFELKSAKSTVTQQQLAVDELLRKVNNLAVKASVAGIVGNLLVQPKSAVTKNQALMTLVDLSAFEAQLQVPESYANELGLGMDVALKIGDQNVMGKLSAISPEVNNREVTTRVRFSQEDVKNIRQNQRLSARVLLENKEDVLMLRRGAFLDSGGHIAYKVEGDIATRININTGATSIRSVEILDGLRIGDEVIVSNYEPFEKANTVLLRQ
ncbi:efflux transporter periplasmic adaptor subunit [Pseudoalteromonas citrea]|uniref:Efflux transporter periplasmic adaptor subunit n=1 Tax=Pseudoalteromonas citrea TaxID=43655 RepID=A0A5S3XM54_9GAMM|nr:HlyD family efflux transporter periplasmic adaptor subunit [Pseudoalteromonas citrea]TMP40318.1 efflux transporter periplasmic adaptor subunit [Pseudoalteromonas citrea]TMP56933.1 efflux transporter periplasmic adaptor subunit [Pseudoalteromonas citrea]